MAGISGVARGVILADLEGASPIWVIADAPLAEDWRESFRVRERALPDVRIVSEAPASALMLPAERYPTREGMRALRSDGPAALLDDTLFWRAGTPRDLTWRTLVASMKPSEGWVGRNINRPISFRMSAVLLRTDISPNVVTWFTFALAVVMFGVLASGTAWGLALGGALYQAVSVIDCVDGDIARVTFRTSKSGAALDTALDMIANLGFLVGVGIGIVRVHGWGELEVAVEMIVVAACAMLLMATLLRLGPKRGSFDVLRYALEQRLAPLPRFRSVVMTVEKMFKRDAYALFAAVLCLAGFAWAIPRVGLAGVCIWLAAIVWCAPLIARDKAGALLPAHLKTQ
jgi:phosphatidylglycerophosphate synthase